MHCISMQIKRLKHVATNTGLYILLFPEINFVENKIITNQYKLRILQNTRYYLSRGYLIVLKFKYFDIMKKINMKSNAKTIY